MDTWTSPVISARTPHGTGPIVKLVEMLDTFPIGEAEVRRSGHHGLAILSLGTMLAPAAVIAAGA